MNWPIYEEDEIEGALAVLRSGKVNYWTGEEAKAFEREFAEYCGTSHAVACMNGTVALEMALKALGVGPGDEVVVTPRSFIASVSCVPWAGATPVFADVCSHSGNLTAETIESVLTEKTRAILVVHLAGWPCDMDPIMDLARERGLRVIEDCSQAHGAVYKGRVVGSIGDFGAYSFCQDKIISTGGEGGMLLTDDEGLWKRAWSWKEHGKDWSTVFEKKHAPGFRWLHESLGSNGRMTEMQAAIGRVQLSKLDGWVKRRAEIAALFRDAAEASGVMRAPWPKEESSGAFYRYVAHVLPSALREGWSRDRIVAEASARGVRCMQGTCSEIYLEKAFDGTAWRPEASLPAAKELGDTSVTFLTHHAQDLQEVERDAAVLGEITKDAAL